MANVDGEWDCVTNTPMGEQKARLTVHSDGASWTGTMSSPLGAVDIADGSVEGDTLHWKVEMKSPFPMMLTCRATVTGDTIEGGITAGAFGTSPLQGVRAA